MALTAQQRVELLDVYMRDRSAMLAGGAATIPVTKPDLRAAIAAIDDWIEANATAINQAIPLPARSALNPAQKAALFSYVAVKRYTNGS